MQDLSKHWDEIHKKYNSTYDNWLNKYLPLLISSDLVVELGCGRAYCSNYLFQNGLENIIACDFSVTVLNIVKQENPHLLTQRFDMSNGLPFENNSVDAIIADLSLHYFDSATTTFLFAEIYRILKDDGYLIARVNSTNDQNHIPINDEEIEKNYFYDGNIYKKFFEEEDFESLFKNFKVHTLEQINMSRYEKPKVLWEFCIKKESPKKLVK